MIIQSGDLWLANIPFTNASGSKRRPVLVLWLDAQDLVVAAVTSALPRSSTDVVLADVGERNSPTVLIFSLFTPLVH